jgi:pyridoxamine 5'-phosphate oxidase family protein
MPSTSFSQAEIDYLKSQPLARLATVSSAGQPDAAPVGFEFDGQHFYIGGYNLAGTRKYRNIAGGHAKVALVIDDLQSVNPWRPRGIRIYGTAEIVRRAGRLGAGDYIRISPQVSWSWAINPSAPSPGRRAMARTVHAQPA